MIIVAQQGLLSQSVIAITSSDDHTVFMKTNCAESCGFCEKESENTEEEGQTSDCADNSEHATNCPGWKNMGYCEAGLYDHLKFVMFLSQWCYQFQVYSSN